MFLKNSSTTIKGKTYDNYKIVQSYREKGKIKHRTIVPLGKLTEEEAGRLRLALKAYSNPSIIVAPVDQINVTEHLDFLEVAVLHQLWHQWELDRFLKEERWVQAMVLNRCLLPVSKIQIKEWVAGTILPAYYSENILETNEFDVYRELDRFNRQEAELQSFLYKQLSNRFSLSEAVFYDITSTYFEGAKCVLASYGYSRDHRPDRQQIVIALMVTAQGYPFYWKVMDGSTQDITTIKELMVETTERFGIKEGLLVMDRGMVSASNLELMEGKWQYISAMDRDEIYNSLFFTATMPEPIKLETFGETVKSLGFIPHDEQLFFQEFTSANRRYILTIDEARLQQERLLLQQKLNKLEAWVKLKNQELAQAQKSRKKEVLQSTIDSLLRGKRLSRLVAIDIAPLTLSLTNKKGKNRQVNSYQLSMRINETAYQRELKLHGITCFITNTPAEKMSAAEVIRWYRRKNKVEEAFHEIKSHLQLRPLKLTREERVKAHVSICVLAYFFYNDMEQRLKGSGLSPEKALNLLAKCQVNRIAFNSINQIKLDITEPSEKQLDILKMLDCEAVVDRKKISKVLKKAENWLL